MIVKLSTEHCLKFLSLKGGFTCSSEYTLVKMPHCWKSCVMAHLILDVWCVNNVLDTVCLDVPLHVYLVCLNGYLSCRS